MTMIFLPLIEPLSLAWIHFHLLGTLGNKVVTQPSKMKMLNLVLDYNIIPIS